MCKISRLKLKLPWRKPEITLKLTWNAEICPFCHPWPRNFTQFADFTLKFFRFCDFGEKSYTVAREILHSFLLRCTLYRSFLPLSTARAFVLSWNLPLFQREKNQLVPAPLLWYPSSIKTCTRRTAADFTERNVHVSREKSPLSPRKMSTFSEKSYTLLIYIK